VSHRDRRVFQHRSRPLLGRPVFGQADVDEKGVGVVMWESSLSARASAGTAIWRTPRTSVVDDI
jgi:hypothetical protein